MDNEWSQFEEVAPAESQAAPQTWQDFEEVPVDEPQSQPQPEQQPGRFESLSAETWSRLKNLNKQILKSPDPRGALAMGAYEVAKSGIKSTIGAVTGGLSALNVATAQPEHGSAGRPDLRYGDLTPQGVIEKAAEDWSDPPETEVGKALQEAISYPFEWWEEQAYDIAYGAGEPNQTLGATGAYTALMFLPAVVGMATGAGIGAAGRVKGAPKAPHSKTLRAEASELYRKADEAKGGVLAQSYDGVLEAIVKKLTDEGYDPGLHPKTAAALNNLQSKAGNNQTLKGVEINRRVINNARGSIEASDARMAGEMLDVYDDWMRSLKAKDMLMGNTDAVPLYQQAREVWSRKMKADELEWAIERANLRSSANYSGANFETALRQEFKSILLNKKRRRMFNEDEQKAIRAVADGDFGTNILRLTGKLAPSRGVISAAPGGALMYTGEPMLGATLWAAGEVGKKGSQMMTKKRAYDALDRVARSPETR